MPARFYRVPFFFAAIACASESTSGSGVDFEKGVRPILEERCFDCHGEDKQKSHLRLDTTTGILRGGESGESLLVGGRSAESYLIMRVTSENKKEFMPPKGDRLTEAQIATLRLWIDQGAKMPGMEAAAASLKLKTDHWSFQQVKRPAVPASGDAFVRGDIDEFVLETLRGQGLVPSPVADKATLIRRVYLVMHGMPPSPQEVADFQNDALPDAYARLVDRVLASPRYGERWARHWMDVVRYADSNGFETNRERKTAYHYRDYLIESLNADKPYDQFIKEQIAGDAVGADAATGFLVAGQYDIVKSADENTMLTQRQDELADMVNTTGTAFLGLTIGCARCHNHKFDPILAKDYYAVQAVFAGVNHGERPLRKKPAAEAPPKLMPPVNARMNEETFAPVEAVAVKFTILATNSAEPCIDELEIYDEAGVNVALSAKPRASGTYPASELHRLEHINDGRLGNSRSWISNTAGAGWVQLDFPAATRIRRIIWGRDREARFADRVATKYKIEAASASGTWMTLASSDDREPFGGKGDLAWVGTFSQPDKTHRLYRGEAMQKREVVAPDALSVTGTLGLAVDEPEQRRRVALAEWIASPQNPLTARVLVNRLWHYIFGQGIVDTPGDFGANGSRPTHPELLDWLADEFVKSGWSIKHMQRLILLSATFQQSSEQRADAAAVDAGGRLLWRFTPRRLEAEAIRDSMLAVSGALDLRMGGPGFYLMDVVEENVMHYFPKETYTPAEFRRMAYQFRIRQTTDGVFGSFDCPDGSSVMARRSRSNTPLQALNLFNSGFVIQQAGILAKRLATDAGEKPESQVDLAFRLFYAHSPDAIEMGHSTEMVRAHGLQSFARALYNTSEFLFVF